MYAAHNPKLLAGVAWYGNVSQARVPGDKAAIDVAAQIKQPVLALYGGADPGIPSESIEKMMASLKAAGNAKLNRPGF
jgi:carboxymethylenebutenolidase